MVRETLSCSVNKETSVTFRPRRRKLTKDLYDRVPGVWIHESDYSRITQIVQTGLWKPPSVSNGATSETADMTIGES